MFWFYHNNVNFHGINVQLIYYDSNKFVAFFKIIIIVGIVIKYSLREGMENMQTAIAANIRSTVVRKNNAFLFHFIIVIFKVQRYQSNLRREKLKLMQLTNWSLTLCSHIIVSKYIKKTKIRIKIFIIRAFLKFL